MSSVETTSKLDLDSTWLTRMQQDFDAARITDDEMCETTRTLVDKYSYMVVLWKSWAILYLKYNKPHPLLFFRPHLRASLKSL